MQTVSLSTRDSTASASTRKWVSSGAVRIASPSISQAFWNEKWLDAGTTTFGDSTGFCFFAIRNACMFDSVPPLVAYPPAFGWCIRVASLRTRSSSSSAVPGKRPGSPRFVSRNMACARAATGWGGVHIELSIFR
ncbi:MAG: hypothetical protein BWX50_00482 [Euryarchaeota archaeon ADurb.Bin009]|nr:MAG: hypothetical protein BWX50_00482 [Euryarchaeota archaeon ADurb.Bin009]